MTDKERYQANAATAATLLDAGIELMRQNLKRRHPTRSEAEIDSELRAWMHRESDLIPGDTAGAVCVRTIQS